MAFADELVLEALFSIALGFQPKVRIPKVSRRVSDVLWILQRESGDAEKQTNTGGVAASNLQSLTARPLVLSWIGHC